MNEWKRESPQNRTQKREKVKKDSEREKENLRVCEVSKSGGEIPTTCIASIFHLLFSLL